MIAVARAVTLSNFYGPHRGVLDLDVEVSAAEVFSFLGPNGAGKDGHDLASDEFRPSRPHGPAVRARPQGTDELAAASLDFAAASGAFRLVSQVEHVLERSLRAPMLEPIVEHQTLDDPAPKAEGVESIGCVAVERLGVCERVRGWCLRR